MLRKGGFPSGHLIVVNVGIPMRRDLTFFTRFTVG